MFVEWGPATVCTGGVKAAGQGRQDDGDINNT
jgi:hypothetical protein